MGRKPDEIIVQNAETKGLRIASLSRFHTQEPALGNHTFIMNYSAIPPEHMKEAIARLCQVFAEAEASLAITAPAHE